VGAPSRHHQSYKNVSKVSRVEAVAGVDVVVDSVPILARVSADSGVAVVEPRRGAASSSCGC